MNIYNFFGYTGSFFMAAFAYTMAVPLAIIGLALLTVQSVNNSTHNLTVLNLISIGGFLTNYL